MSIDLKTIALSAAVFGAAFVAPVSAATLGEAVTQGQLTIPAVQQLIATTGLSVEEALNMTLDDVVAIRWQDD